MTPIDSRMSSSSTKVRSAAAKSPSVNATNPSVSRRKVVNHGFPGVPERPRASVAASREPGRSARCTRRVGHASRTASRAVPAFPRVPARSSSGRATVVRAPSCPPGARRERGARVLGAPDLLATVAVPLVLEPMPLARGLVGVNALVPDQHERALLGVAARTLLQLERAFQELVRRFHALSARRRKGRPAMCRRAGQDPIRPARPPRPPSARLPDADRSSENMPSLA